jgi:hypothetical protein
MTETEQALELATTSQLIAELTRRHTFQGVILHTEHRNDWTHGKRTFKFDYTHNNLSREEAIGIIQAVGDKLSF